MSPSVGSFRGVAPELQRSILDVTALLGVSPRTLHFYEQLGLIRAGRDARNARIYDLETFDRLREIVLLRRTGIGLAAIQALPDDPKSEDYAVAVRRLLTERRRCAERTLEAVDSLLAQFQQDGVVTRAVDDAQPTPLRRAAV